MAIWRTTWILIDTDNFFNSDDIMTSLLKKLSIFIKIGVIKRYRLCLVSFKIVDRIRRQSSWASCELCSHRRRRRDKTVFVASAVCIGLYGMTSPPTSSLWLNMPYTYLFAILWWKCHQKSSFYCWRVRYVYDCTLVLSKQGSKTWIYRHIVYQRNQYHDALHYTPVLGKKQVGLRFQ